MYEKIGTGYLTLAYSLNLIIVSSISFLENALISWKDILQGDLRDYIYIDCTSSYAVHRIQIMFVFSASLAIWFFNTLYSDYCIGMLREWAV